MYEVQLITAVNLFEPYRICGDIGDKLFLTEEAAAFAVQQKLAMECGEVPGLPQYEEIVPPPEPVGTLQKMNFAPEHPDEPVRPDLIEDDSPVQRALDGVEEPVPLTLKKPDGRTSQKGWAAYAVAMDPDLTTERAEGMSKQELMSQYGGRW